MVVLLLFITNRILLQSNLAPLNYFSHLAFVFLSLGFLYGSCIGHSFSGWNTLYLGTITNSLARTHEDQEPSSLLLYLKNLSLFKSKKVMHSNMRNFQLRRPLYVICPTSSFCASLM